MVSMSNTARKIEEAASLWIARMEAGPLDPDARAAFESWCARDSRHFGAFVRLEAVSERLDRASALQGIEFEPATPKRRAWVPMALAASLALALFVGWQVAAPVTETQERRALATGTGEQFRTNLADGSVLELNTDTRVEIGFEPVSREIEMANGEAVFDVAKDPDRPFIVRTPYGSVRAVGTVFTVRVDGQLTVMVSEGTVAVDQGARELARISAGEVFNVSANGDLKRQAKSVADIERTLAWREGKVAFAGETLREAANEFNRYNDVKIVIEDPDVARMRFGGYFRATDPKGFVAALENALPVEAKVEGERIVLLPATEK